MYIVFFSTSNVFKGEELLKAASIDCTVVPTPVQDKAYCGVCLKTETKFDKELLGKMEFVVLEDQ